MKKESTLKREARALSKSLITYDKKILAGLRINDYKKCPKCNKTENLEVREYNPTWHDGEVWCKKCNVKVRNYDAG